ncbi:DUF664 domain-containing protein [Streptomyces sp. NRRL F-2580]|uniref:mycothiol transferase n=1 Tax=Streptomyces sp. NRRL F-2580 TaxID=1463841 RepID=UPI000A7301DD|nr:DUF664 domain-containing protein [Streptomyces sp. NRRL F-2580]
MAEPPLAAPRRQPSSAPSNAGRATLGWKCSGLDAAGLRATVGASPLTLGGLLHHLAHGEDSPFPRLWLGSAVGAPWDTVDWDLTPDRDYRSAAEDTPEQLCALWQEWVGRSRAVVDTALGEGGPDQLGSANPSTASRARTRRGEPEARFPADPLPFPGAPGPVPGRQPTRRAST